MRRRLPELLILAMDIGTSSLRTALFDDDANQLPGTLARLTYAVRYFPDGGAELSPTRLSRAAVACLRQTLRAYRDSATLNKIPIAAISGSGFWHNLMGIDRTGKAITPIFTWADGRSAEDARSLRANLSERAVQLRTGCMLRSSFWPAKLRWLRRTQPRLFARVVHWVSPADWIWNQLFGMQTTSESMAGATGLYNQGRRAWDDRLCAFCDVDENQLAQISESESFVRRKPIEFRGARIFFPIGDGAAGNLGSGADRPGRLAINVGTSAAVRMLQPRRDAGRAKLPFGLFRYLLDSNHSIIGGAVSNAGNLRVWCLRELRLRDNPTLARRAAAEESISVLPFWVNERAPTWPEKEHGTIVGLMQATSAKDIFRTTTTSVFNRLAQIIKLTKSVTGRADRVIVSGGVIRSTSTLQILADTIGRDIEVPPVTEASLRGAAVYALTNLSCSPAPLRRGRTIRHNPKLAAAHRLRQQRQIELEKLLARF
jgi:gluconokinase